jgi:hypothetical protein
MPYTIMVWLTNAADLSFESEKDLRQSDAESRQERRGGTHSGVFVPPLFNRFQYGLFDDEQSAQQALQQISSQLEQNQPLEISERNENIVFLIPASRVHYVVCAEVERPKDTGQSRTQELAQ